MLDDDQALPLLSIADASAVEDAGQVEFALTLSSPTPAPVRMAWHVMAEGNTASRVTSTTGTMVLSAGERTGLLRVPHSHDSTTGADETYTIVLTELMGAAPGDVEAVGVIRDDDQPGVHIEATPARARESDGVATFEFRLPLPVNEEIEIPYSTRAGSALSPEDFTATAGVLRFAPGQTSAIVAIALEDDGIAEQSESFELVLEPPPGVFLSDSSPEATIGDDELAPTVTFGAALGAAVVVSESAGIAAIPVTLSWPSDRMVVAAWQVAGGSAAQGADYALFNDQVVFEAGETSATVLLGILDDDLAEGAEQMELRLTSAKGAEIDAGRSTMSVIVRDDDRVASVLRFADVSASEDGGEALLTWELVPPSGEPVSARYATRDGRARAGEDFAPAAALRRTSSPRRGRCSRSRGPLAPMRGGRCRSRRSFPRRPTTRWSLIGERSTAKRGPARTATFARRSGGSSFRPGRRQHRSIRSWCSTTTFTKTTRRSRSS